MQNLIHAGEAVLASLRLELFRTLLMQKASQTTGSLLGFGVEERQEVVWQGDSAAAGQWYWHWFTCTHAVSC